MKTCLGWFANNTGAEQPTHQCSLISAFVISVLESTISKLATSEISFSLLVSVAEQAGLNLTLSETPKTGFVASRPKYSFTLTHEPSCEKHDFQPYIPNKHSEYDYVHSNVLLQLSNVKIFYYGSNWSVASYIKLNVIKYM